MCFKRQVCFLLFLVSLFFVFSENKSVTSAWQEELYEMEEIEDFRGDIEDIITLNGEMLVSYKDYYYVEGRDKSYYLSVKYGIFWDIYAIEPGYEIQSIKQDDGKYYAGMKGKVLMIGIAHKGKECKVKHSLIEDIVEYKNDKNK